LLGARWIQSMSSHATSFKIRFNIIASPKPRSPNCVLKTQSVRGISELQKHHSHNIVRMIKQKKITREEEEWNEKSIK
jgi:hypothetical protein